MKFEISLFFCLFCVPDALKLSPYPLEIIHQHVVLKQVDLPLFHKSSKIIVFKINVVRQNNLRQCIPKVFVCRIIGIRHTFLNLQKNKVYFLTSTLVLL